MVDGGIKTVLVGERTISIIKTIQIGSLGTGVSLLEQRTELDSHADTSVVGQSTALLIHDFMTPVHVHGYVQSVGQSANCRTVSAVVAYDHPMNGNVYMLVIHQAILIPEMEHNLLCPLQLRDHGVLVNDEPKFLATNPTDDHHAITLPSMTMNDGEPFQIPLTYQRVTSYFPTRRPTREEYETTPDE